MRYINFKLVAAVMDADIVDGDGKHNHIGKIVLIGLARHANENSQSWPSHEAIARYFDISKRSVANGLAWLQVAGYITPVAYVGGGRCHPVHYRINFETLHVVQPFDGEDVRVAPRATFSEAEDGNLARDATFRSVGHVKNVALRAQNVASPAQNLAYGARSVAGRATEYRSEDLTKEISEERTCGLNKSSRIEALSSQREKTPSRITQGRPDTPSTHAQLLLAQELVWPPNEGDGKAKALWNAVTHSLFDAGATETDIRHYVQTIKKRPDIYGLLTGNAILQMHQNRRRAPRHEALEQA